MSKKENKPTEASNEDMFDQFARLVKKNGARVNVADWASILMSNAEDYYNQQGISGLTGDVLLSRTLEISQAAKTHGTIPKHSEHLTIYANDVRKELIASKKIQRKYTAIVTNLTKMAVSFLCKDPLNPNDLIGMFDESYQEIETRFSNTIASYLQRSVARESTDNLLADLDFGKKTFDVLQQLVADFIRDNWDRLEKGL